MKIYPDVEITNSYIETYLRMPNNEKDEVKFYLTRVLRKFTNNEDGINSLILSLFLRDVEVMRMYGKVSDTLLNSDGSPAFLLDECQQGDFYRLGYYELFLHEIDYMVGEEVRMTSNIYSGNREGFDAPDTKGYIFDIFLDRKNKIGYTVIETHFIEDVDGKEKLSQKISSEKRTFFKSAPVEFMRTSSLSKFYLKD